MGIKKLTSLLVTTLLLASTFVSPVLAAPIDIPASNVQTIWNHVQDMIQEFSANPVDTPVDTLAPIPAKEPGMEKMPELNPAPQPSSEPDPQPKSQLDAQQQSVDKPQFNQFQERVVELVNIERQKEGLHPLSADPVLMKGATAKSVDMVENRYFSHTSPIYGSPFEMMKSFNISYRYAGENIASGQSSPEDVVRAWMNSPGHRANIMSSKFAKIGVGYAYTSYGNYHHYWTQWFTG
ncbi:CAP domain-containing protein [Phosphitispora sp. TUW77]|uniref:CAP domain-containing protein n=1 Tax=Phosphitispora sp. TUW77 TaxID=3152361 RepID=UPI003AB30EA0